MAGLGSVLRFFRVCVGEKVRTDPDALRRDPLLKYDYMKTKKFTTAQAVVQFLLRQQVERDGKRQHFFAGCLGIFGHGCIAG